MILNNEHFTELRTVLTHKVLYLLKKEEPFTTEKFSSVKMFEFEIKIFQQNKI